jgi:hypothetical protein
LLHLSLSLTALNNLAPGVYKHAENNSYLCGGVSSSFSDSRRHSERKIAGPVYHFAGCCRDVE